MKCSPGSGASPSFLAAELPPRAKQRPRPTAHSSAAPGLPAEPMNPAPYPGAPPVRIGADEVCQSLTPDAVVV